MKYTGLLFVGLALMVTFSPSIARASASIPVAGNWCPEVGETKMDAGKTGIFACVNPGPAWKSMTSTTPNCRVCIRFADGGGSSQLGSWQCTPYGGGTSLFATDSNAFDPDGAFVSFDCL